jgi:hypothetical protein
MYYRLFGHYFLWSQSDIVGINALILILKIIGQCDIKHIITLPIKTRTSVLNISIYIITSITARPIWLAAILPIMSLLTSITAVTLYIIKGVIQTRCPSKWFIVISNPSKASANVTVTLVNKSSPLLSNFGCLK